ncbi:pyruvate, phosphate dikinase [Nisaea sp.]|uniref:pyruvate, phosphate dikinase n=1 Tax=Nisaea sp. TaxID=2024842 RepID=UPI003B526F47
MEKWIYTFGEGAAEGSAGMEDLLGTKGANLAEMSAIGLPVPPGFTIATGVCAYYHSHGGSYPPELEAALRSALAGLETARGASFGDPENPLLVSVRSGGAASMPGMMDTVLNLGLNDAVVEGLARRTGDRRFAFDCYRRFIQMYAEVVLDLDAFLFEETGDEIKEDFAAASDRDLTADAFAEMVRRFKEIVRAETGESFPDRPDAQLWGAIGGVIRSWNNQRAVIYRTLHNIPHDVGTAVTVQAMVFGNRGEKSVTGVAFTRNPSTGVKEPYGEYLPNAQGEDVVAGLRTPLPLVESAAHGEAGPAKSLQEQAPELFGKLLQLCDRLERHYGDVQDIEFTVEEGKLFLLQTRPAKRTVEARLKIAVDLHLEGLISREQAVMRVNPDDLDSLLYPSVDPAAEARPIARGLPASPGAASGIAVFDPDDAIRRARDGEDVILVRKETSPNDIHGMHAAVGIVTARGGLTSHAAVVARGMGRPCICGASAVRIASDQTSFMAGDVMVRDGDEITLDGTGGGIYLGRIPTVEPTLPEDLKTLVGWADGIRYLAVRANVETMEDARAARRYGADGVGLVATEHTFFAPARIMTVRELTLARNERERRPSLDRLLPLQRADFTRLFRELRGFPVAVRLLDPPLDEVLPVTDGDYEETAEALGLPIEAVRKRVAAVRQIVPVLGHRGCRLAISYPEITEMQVRAMFEAASAVMQEFGETVTLEITVPLVVGKREFDFVRVIVDRVAADVEGETGCTVNYRVGTLIELPRAALRAGEIAKSADFFSFGTDDLTRTVFGMSRDDADAFLTTYMNNSVVDLDPFVTLDIEGVGELVRIATERGRAENKDLLIGICGEHGGDAKTVRFCHSIGLDYVSCAPNRLPVARIAAAQATIHGNDVLLN